MLVNRRHLVRCFIAGLIGAASGRAHAGSRNAARRTENMQVEFPSFELQASASALRQLTSGITGWRIERVGNRVSSVWLMTADGTTWSVSVEQRDVRPMFEVFTLGMLSMSDLRERWERWKPPVLPEEMPERLRQLLTLRPPAPAPPSAFDAWPLRSWRTEVVRRAEFVVEGEDLGPTFGNNPNPQSSTRPQAVPNNASASCEVAAGVLFTDEGRSLLLAVDWTPMNMLVLQDAAEISAFISDCELVSMPEYLSSRSV